ncbi:MAG: hypothetical protein AB7S36_11755 [Planctomycetota bacterium]
MPLLMRADAPGPVVGPTITILTLLAFALAHATPALAHDDDDEPPIDNPAVPPGALADPLSRLTVGGYTTLGAYWHDWQTQPDRQHETDLERLAVSLRYRLFTWLEVEAEIEFEHGGTGSAFEFERREEGGEFEFESEKSGEVVIEELEIEIEIADELLIRFGHLVVPVGFINNGNETPLRYFTVWRPEAETAVLPAVWHDNSLQLTGRINDGMFRYAAGVVRSLDSSRFSSANWIANGSATTFELAHADDWGFCGMFQWRFATRGVLAVSGFVGNSRGNRPRRDMTQDAGVIVLNAHARWEEGPFIIRGSVVWGNVQNTEAITFFNQQLANIVDSPGTPVGKTAIALFVEAGIDVLGLIDRSLGWQVWLFGRLDYYDTMLTTAGALSDDPRAERISFSAGVNVMFRPWLVFKAHYTQRELGLTANNVERTFALGAGLQF